MVFSNFFKKPEYKKFNITPRYWDPAKEEREERERRVKAELGIKSENGNYYSSIKGSFSAGLKHKHNPKSSLRTNSSFRVFLIFIILAVLTFGYIFGWDELISLVRAFL